MNVLIFSMPGDYHTAAVQWALRKSGARADVVMMSNVPQRAALTMTASKKASYFLETKDGSVSLSEYQVVWFRRTVRPVPDPRIHPSDWAVARRDWRTMAESLEWHLGRNGAFCVNHPALAAQRRSKPLQLEIAAECGFDIPPTLISNSAAEIRSFIRENSARGLQTIAKPLAAVLWRDTDMNDFGFMTEVVTEADTDSADVASAPVIFQPLVAKRSEVRVNVFGETVIAVEIDSQADESSKIDFRKVDDWQKLSHKRLELDEALEVRIVGLARSLGSRFAAMDFIISPDGRWIFLESNEMGNWLWIESCNPAIPLLDCFTQFLLSGSDKFRYDWSRSNRVDAASYTGAYGSHVRAYIANQLDSDVQPETAIVYRE